MVLLREELMRFEQNGRRRSPLPLGLDLTELMAPYCLSYTMRKVRRRLQV